MTTTTLHEIIPKAGLVYSEKSALSEILSKPKIMPLKSITLERIEEMERRAADIFSASRPPQTSQGSHTAFANEETAAQKQLQQQQPQRKQDTVHSSEYIKGTSSSNKQGLAPASASSSLSSSTNASSVKVPPMASPAVAAVKAAAAAERPATSPRRRMPKKLGRANFAYNSTPLRRGGRMAEVVFEKVTTDYEDNNPLPSFDAIELQITQHPDTVALAISDHYCVGSMAPLSALFQRFPSIESLQFTRCTFLESGPDGIEALCKVITDKSFRSKESPPVPSNQSSGGLQELVFEECSFVGSVDRSDDGNIPLEILSKAITKAGFSTLRVLAIEKVSERGLTALIHALTQPAVKIRSLSLPFLEITPDSRHLLTELILRAHALCILNLVDCSLMDNATASVLARGLARNSVLKVLDISLEELETNSEEESHGAKAEAASPNTSVFVTDEGMETLIKALESNSDSKLGVLRVSNAVSEMELPLDATLQNRLKKCLERNAHLLLEEQQREHGGTVDENED